MKKSFIVRLSKMVMLQMATLLFLGGIIGWTAYKTAESDMESSSENFMALYGTQLENRINGIDRLMGNLLHNNSDLLLLQSDDDLTRHHAALNLQNTMANIMQIDTNAELAVVAENMHETCLKSVSTLSYEERNLLQKYVQDLAAQNTTGITGGWESLWIGEKAYLCREAVQNGRALVIFVSVNTLLHDFTTFINNRLAVELAVLRHS